MVGPFSVKGTFKDSQWMPKTSSSTKPYTYYFIFPCLQLYTFSLSGSPLLLLFDLNELPASLHLHFEAIVK